MSDNSISALIHFSSQLFAHFFSVSIRIRVSDFEFELIAVGNFFYLNLFSGSHPKRVCHYNELKECVAQHEDYLLVDSNIIVIIITNYCNTFIYTR